MENAANRILEFIKKTDHERGQTLEREIAGMDADQQLDRVMEALDAVKPREARAAEAPALLPEDRQLLDRAKRAMDQFWAQEGKPK